MPSVIEKLLAQAIKNPEDLAAATVAMEAHFERTHRGLVLLNALLRQRHDLPADRIPAYRAVCEFIGFDPDQVDSIPSPANDDSVEPSAADAIPEKAD